MIAVSESHYKAWFPLDHNRIMKSCIQAGSSSERLITTERKNLSEIGSDLRPKRSS